MKSAEEWNNKGYIFEPNTPFAVRKQQRVDFIKEIQRDAWKAGASAATEDIVTFAKASILQIPKELL